VTARRPARPDAATPSRFNPTWLAARLRELIGPLRGRRLCLAFSGGMDSTALLCALAALRTRQRCELRALHVNHQLHPDARDWARQARATARRLRVRCKIIEIDVARARGESPEAAAREARYEALTGRLEPDELLLTAPHQEDQLETFLLALLRGSGVRGLSAMQPITTARHALLVRPLLSVSRVQLEQYVRRRGFKWTSDPSNEDERFDRNYLRRVVFPALRARWPAVAATVSRSAAHLAEARSMLDLLARESLIDARDGAALRVSVLRRLPLAQRYNALRFWIAERGLPAPDQKRLREIAGPLLAARQDAQASVHWLGAQLRRHADLLLADPFPEVSAPLLPLEVGEWNWRVQPWLSLGAAGSLGIVPDRHGDLLIAALPPTLRVRYRRGGERLANGQGHVALKDLLQKNALPPWQRGSVPLLLDHRRIIAVADLWLDPKYRSNRTVNTNGGPEAGSKFGRLRWRRLRQTR